MRRVMSHSEEWDITLLRGIPEDDVTCPAPGLKSDALVVSGVGGIGFVFFPRFAVPFLLHRGAVDLRSKFDAVDHLVLCRTLRDRPCPWAVFAHASSDDCGTSAKNDNPEEGTLDLIPVPRTPVLRVVLSQLTQGRSFFFLPDSILHVRVGVAPAVDLHHLALPETRESGRVRARDCPRGTFYCTSDLSRFAGLKAEYMVFKIPWPNRR